jgi:streptogramin lyase
MHMGTKVKRVLAVAAVVAAAAAVGLVGAPPAATEAGRTDPTFLGHPDLDGPQGMALHEASGTLYIGQYEEDALTAFDPEAESFDVILDDDDAETDINGPSRLAVDQTTGDVWYSNCESASVGRYDPGTGETEVFTTSGMGCPWGVVLDATGDAWFASYDGDVLGTVDATTGAVTTFDDPLIDGPNELTFGPDGNLWFTNYDGDEIGVFDPDTEDVTVFTAAGIDAPWAITSAGGNLWFTDHLGGHIGRITTAGAITLFGSPAGNGRPIGIDPGPAGTVYFTYRTSPERTESGVGRLTRATGHIELYPDEAASNSTDELEVGPAPGDGDDTRFWYISYNNDQLSALDPPEKHFTDVGVDNPFFDETAFLFEEGISTGYQPGPTYRGPLTTNRAAMSAFFYRLSGEPAFTPPGSPSFSDVPLSHPFFDEIEWLAEEGITTGFPDGTFKPSQAVTRQSMSAFMYRLADSPAFDDPLTATFSDVPLTHTFFHEVEWMNSEAITTGFPDGTFRPAENVTRAAMSAFLYRLAPLLDD